MSESFSESSTVAGKMLWQIARLKLPEWAPEMNQLFPPSAKIEGPGPTDFARGGNRNDQAMHRYRLRAALVPFAGLRTGLDGSRSKDSAA
jgi:hypothetical protein